MPSSCQVATRACFALPQRRSFLLRGCCQRERWTWGCYLWLSTDLDEIPIAESNHLENHLEFEPFWTVATSSVVGWAAWWPPVNVQPGGYWYFWYWVLTRPQSFFNGRDLWLITSYLDSKLVNVTLCLMSQDQASAILMNLLTILDHHKLAEKLNWFHCIGYSVGRWIQCRISVSWKKGHCFWIVQLRTWDVTMSILCHCELEHLFSWHGFQSQKLVVIQVQLAHFISGSCGILLDSFPLHFIECARSVLWKLRSSVWYWALFEYVTCWRREKNNYTANSNSNNSTPVFVAMIGNVKMS